MYFTLKYIKLVILCSERVSRPVFPQIAQQILQKPVVDLRSSSRAWKVNLVGEGADDAGGVFDEMMAQMCEVIINKERAYYANFLLQN